MEQKKSTSTHVSSIAFWQGHQANSIEKEEYFQNLVLYLLNIHMEKKYFNTYIKFDTKIFIRWNKDKAQSEIKKATRWKHRSIS